MLENLSALLTFDTALIAIFAGLSMMIVQMLKNTFAFVDKNPMLYVLLLALFFAAMVVYEVEEVLSIAIITFLIMSAASGIYSSSKKETTVNLPDYGDSQ